MSTNDPRTAQERAENLAEKKFPVQLRPNGMEPPPKVRRAFVNGFLARDAEPTTVSAEQIEKAAIAHYVGDKLDPGRDWRDVPDIYQGHMLAEMERSFRAAGFRIEGDPNE